MTWILPELGVEPGISDQSYGFNLPFIYAPETDVVVGVR